MFSKKKYCVLDIMRECAVCSVMSNSATSWTIAHQAPLSLGFPRQAYWSGLLCLPPGDLPKPRIKPRISYVSCIGRQVLYHERCLGSPQDLTHMRLQMSPCLEIVFGRSKLRWGLSGGH